MASIVEYDVTNVEESEYGDGTEEPKPGIYPARIIRAERRTEKSDGKPANDIKVLMSLGGDYRLKASYIGLGDESDWKLKEFIRALDLKEKGKLDLEKLGGKMIRVKINPDTWENEYQGKVGRLMKGQPDDELPKPGASSNGAGPAASANDDEPEAGPQGTVGSGYPPTDEFPDGYEPVREDENDDNVGSYDDWSDEDVEAEFKDRALTAPGGRGKKRDKMITALRADDANPIEPEGEADAEPTTSGEEDDYETWSVEELEKEFADRNLDLPSKPRGSNAATRYATALVEALRADDAADPFES